MRSIVGLIGGRVKITPGKELCHDGRYVFVWTCPILPPASSVLRGDGLFSEIVAELEVEGDEGLLSAGTRDQMFLILREAVRNALAHSGMGHVRVVLRIGEGQATGIVEDDGGGFDPEGFRRNDSGGLLYMEERAALVGGRLRAESAPDRGTRVAVEVPLRPQDASLES